MHIFSNICVTSNKSTTEIDFADGYDGRSYVNDNCATWTNPITCTNFKVVQLLLLICYITELERLDNFTSCILSSLNYQYLFTKQIDMPKAPQFQKMYNLK